MILVATALKALPALPLPFHWLGTLALLIQIYEAIKDHKKHPDRQKLYKKIIFIMVLILMIWVAFFFIARNAEADKIRLEKAVENHNYQVVEGVIDRVGKTASTEVRIFFESGEVFYSRNTRTTPYECDRIGRIINMTTYNINGKEVEIGPGDYVRIEYTYKLGDKRMPQDTPCVLRLYLKWPRDENYTGSK